MLPREHQDFNFFSSITKIWPLITGQVTGIFSASIFQSLTTLPNQTETGIITVLLGVFYILVERTIRKLVSYSDSYKKNIIWSSVVNDWMDALYRFWIFLMIQYTNFLVKNRMTGDDPSILFQVIFILSIVLTLLLVVSIMEYLQEKMTNELSPSFRAKISKLTIFGKNSVDVFLSVYNGMYGVVVQFYSDFLFDEVSVLPNSTAIGIIGGLLLIAYLIVQSFIKDLLRFFGNAKSPLTWRFTLNILDFFVVFTIFFIVKYIGLFISTISDVNQFGTYARFVALFSIYIVLYSFFAFLTFFNGDKNEEEQTEKGPRNENESKLLWLSAIGKVWPKISGTTTGLFSNIIVTNIVTGSNQTRVFGLVISFLILWSMFEPFIRRKIEEYGDGNKLWKSVVSQLLDFPVALCPLLIYTLFSNMLNNQILSGDIGLFSQVVVIFSIQMVSICFFTTIKHLSN